MVDVNQTRRRLSREQADLFPAASFLCTANMVFLGSSLENPLWPGEGGEIFQQRLRHVRKDAIGSCQTSNQSTLGLLRAEGKFARFLPLFSHAFAEQFEQKISLPIRSNSVAAFG